MVGAGVAGLVCARTLREHGAQVTVFEKEDTPGGRAATLIAEAGPFDHGAQYFTAERDRFVTAVRCWEADGIVQHWRGRIVAFGNGGVEDKTRSVERFVAVPGMRRLGLHLAQGLDVRFGQSIARVERSGRGWLLQAEDMQTSTHGPFDAVCVTTPSDIAAALLREHTLLAELAQAVNWDPCWTVAMALSRPSGVDFEAAFINDDPILGWAAHDSAKPRRLRIEGIAERWILNAKPRWSRRYFEMDEASVARWLARAFSARLRRTLNPVHLRAVRWAHAAPMNPLPQLCLWDCDRRLGMAGDWCDGPRIEGAYLSGLALAEVALG